MKHTRMLSRLPEKADDFTAGQKLTLAAGVTDAIAAFLQSKEGTDTETE